MEAGRMFYEVLQKGLCSHHLWGAAQGQLASPALTIKHTAVSGWAVYIKIYESEVWIKVKQTQTRHFHFFIDFKIIYVDFCHHFSLIWTIIVFNSDFMHLLWKNSYFFFNAFNSDTLEKRKKTDTLMFPLIWSHDLSDSLAAEQQYSAAFVVEA